MIRGAEPPDARWRAVALAALAWALLATATALWLLWLHWRGALAEPETAAPVEVASEPPDRRELLPVSFAELPGWHEDTLGEALPALTKTCARLSSLGAGSEVAPVEIGGFVADWIGPCQRMVSLERERPRDHDALRALLETDFRAFQIKNRDLEEGLFTGYYEPLLRGSRRRRAPYDVPLYKLPRDLITIDLGRFREELRGQRLAGRVEGRELLPYAERRAIEGGALARRDLELLWVDDPIDAFFLQIQGSGQIELPDGRRLRLGYAGQNGHPYFAIGRELIARGALTREQVSLQSIRAWLQENPEQATEVMALNASYVFFRELEGEGPIGSHGVVLTPGRSLAIDRSFLPLGAPLWLDTTFPTPERVPTTVMTSSAGATATEPSPHSVDPAQPASAPLQRLVVAQDTGGAIRGPVRGDLFWGAGEEAEELAGHMKQQGRLYLLLPIALAERVLGDRHASGPAPARQKELASASVGNVGRRSVRR